MTLDSLLNKSNNAKRKLANEIEKAWANEVIGGTGGQWTTALCQDLVREALNLLERKHVRKGTAMRSSVTSKQYAPDLECDDFVYEVKGRSWTMSGTAGEKILGVPLKYGEIPTIYHKPLRIVLVGYQEHEARHGFAFGDLLNPALQTAQLKETLQYFKDRDIEYVGFTDLLNELGLKYSAI